MGLKTVLLALMANECRWMLVIFVHRRSGGRCNWSQQNSSTYLHVYTVKPWWATKKKKLLKNKQSKEQIVLYETLTVNKLLLCWQVAQQLLRLLFASHVTRLDRACNRLWNLHIVVVGLVTEAGVLRVVLRFFCLLSLKGGNLYSDLLC